MKKSETCVVTTQIINLFFEKSKGLIIVKILFSLFTPGTLGFCHLSVTFVTKYVLRYVIAFVSSAYCGVTNVTIKISPGTNVFTRVPCTGFYISHKHSCHTPSDSILSKYISVNFLLIFRFYGSKIYWRLNIYIPHTLTIINTIISVYIYIYIYGDLYIYDHFILPYQMWTTEWHDWR